MPFDEEPVHAASNEEPTSRVEKLKRAPWRKIFLWAAVIFTAWALLSSGPGILAVLPFMVAVWVISWLTVAWLRRDPEMSFGPQKEEPEPVAPKRLDKDVALTLDEEIAFTALVSSLNEEPKDSRFDVIVYKDMLRMPWSKKTKK